MSLAPEAAPIIAAFFMFAICFDFGVRGIDRRDALLFWTHTIKNCVWILGLSLMGPILALVTNDHYIWMAAGSIYSVIVHSVACAAPFWVVRYNARRAFAEVTQNA